MIVETGPILLFSSLSCGLWIVDNPLLLAFFR